MSCGAGRTPDAACGEPSDGAVYVQACARMHVQEVELCAFHAAWAIEPRQPPVYCTACFETAGGSLVPVTITTKDTT